VFGEDRDRPMERGLAVLPGEAIGKLLRHPRLLLELQEQALMFGGEHWRRQEESPGDHGAITGQELG
jgi:hypothetical protein